MLMVMLILFRRRHKGKAWCATSSRLARRKHGRDSEL
jgi:hypothetical protein